MATRACSSCGANFRKSEYSKNQWARKKGAAKCRGCVAENGAPAPSVKTNHLVERQRQRHISDSDLAAAMEYGERSELGGKDGTTVRYSYKGVVYVATSEGVGITAYRLDPIQCTCNIKDQSMLCNDFRSEYMDGQRCDRVQHAINSFSFDLNRWGRGPASCENLSKSSIPFCLGHNTCKVHQTPTDHLAMLLERQEWSSPKMQDVMADPTMLGYLTLAAAGSLLRPIACKKCHGVETLRRSSNPYDESDTLPWLMHLLDIAESKSKRDRKEMGDDVRGNERPTSAPDLMQSVYVAGGASALGAAALAGNYRCAAELMKRGASVDEAIMSFEIGPLAGGHLPCFLMLQSVIPDNRRFRQVIMNSGHEDIMALFAHAHGKEGFCARSDEQHHKAVELLKGIGMWERCKGTIEKYGVSTTGSMHDGLCLRFIFETSHDEYASGAVVATSLALRVSESALESGQIMREGDLEQYGDPVKDPFVLEFVRRCQSKAEKSHSGNSCRCFSHGIHEILNDKRKLSEDRTLQAVKEHWKK